jgi:hypothetical protein
MPFECLAKHSPGRPATREVHFFIPSFLFLLPGRLLFFALLFFYARPLNSRRAASLLKKHIKSKLRFYKKKGKQSLKKKGIKK